MAKNKKAAKATKPAKKNATKKPAGKKAKAPAEKAPTSTFSVLGRE